MKRIKKPFLSVFWLTFFLAAAGQQGLPPIGQWREHLPYKTAIDAVAGNGTIYCATPFSIFSVDISENSINRLSKISGLNETGVSALGYDAVPGKLLIAYANSNIDIIYRNDIFNIPDIKRENIQADKTIYNIYSLNKNFYLGTGFGVVVIDGEKYEIKDSWVIGNGGNYIKVNGFTSDNSFFYAATAEGLKKTSLNTVNPGNFNNWQTVSGTNGLPAGSCENVLTVQNNVFAFANDSLFRLTGNNWNFFYSNTGGDITTVSTAENKILVCEQQGNNSRVIVLDTNGNILENIQNGISSAAKATVYQNTYWIADRNNSLSRYSSGSIQSFRPGSPDSTATAQMLATGGSFFAASGTVNAQWTGQQNRNGIFKFSEGKWTNYNSSAFPALDSLKDFLAIAINPADNSLWAGSFGGGLLHVKNDNSIEIFKQNSSLSPAIFDPSSYRVAGLAFDAEQNLWISNYGALQSLVVKKRDGQWKRFSIPFALNENAVAQIIIDDLNQKWIISPGGNGLICFNDNNTIDDNTDDRWKLYRMGAGFGNLPSNNVLSIARDKNGFIWIGTDDGIGVIQCPQFVFTSQGCDAILPIVQQGNFAGFLFKGEEVRSIAVDGADRKWIAAKNGVFLISPDGEKVIYRFTEENSPLFSNDVRSIAIDGKTGEVYFGTAKGICSFRSTATEGGVTNQDVLVFPNPVPPGYAGTIAIRGLAENAIVKITELDGRLVYQARALGGQAVWDGKDYMGRRISTGVYLVLVSDDGRKENTAAKIVFINPHSP